jgi:hypothetical protein
MKPLCATCRFAAATATPSGPGLECRRRAPGNYPNACVPAGVPYPWVGAAHWCGEYEAARAAEPPRQLTWSEIFVRDLVGRTR